MPTRSLFRRTHLHHQVQWCLPPASDSSSPNSIKNPETIKVKYIDDGTVAVRVDLNECLVTDPRSRPQPLTYHERSGHILPPENNLLQMYIQDTESFTEENLMKINKNKTKIMKFTNSRNLDFPMEVKFSDETQIESITEIKLLGVIVTNDLKWSSNTSFICHKARTRLWILRRMSHLDLTRNEKFDVYVKEVRSILEFAVPVWHSSLTRKQTSEIESIQKLAFRIILGSSYVRYSDACALFCTETLERRRFQICLKFAQKNIKSEHCLFQIVTLIKDCVPEKTLSKNTDAILPDT